MISTERFVDYTMVAFHMNLINESGHMVLPACQATLKSHEAMENSGLPVVSLTDRGSPVTFLHLSMSWSLMLWT